MNARYLIGFALGAAALVAACSNSDDALLNDADSHQPGLRQPGSSSGSTSGGNAINALKDKDYYKTNVFPFMSASCGSCHSEAGPGPAWITPSDSETSYAQLFQMGYVVSSSRIVLQVAHGGSTTNFLSADQASTYNKWVEMELTDGGGSATPAVLAKLGDCFDRSKFEDMDLGNWRTTRRTKDNNVNNVQNWNENANNCTGCNAATCSTCHSSDEATNFKNSVGNPVLPVSSTFDDTKKANYITKYFGVSPDGKPVASGAIKRKSVATQKDNAYTHPMFMLTPEQWTAIDAFVNDVITKWNAGTCGK